ncbi:hypothetical protein EDD27_7723 [Nonomuraea polychroma]|uniref:Uncharacterized protein n=1 Tax=Nonomuraea polychroma TaxID=46176 RepID=A0A438MHN0_9ACTN|nr:hypothetical protein [Nonomuraea polychroma]RVX44951.1 hypothetical protein EDD27_7723 [Nonomuraea polychroma]
MQRLNGVLIGAVFGMVFVAVNANAPLAPVAGTVLRWLAGLGLAGVIVMWFIAMRRTKGGTDTGEAGGEARGGMFSRKYMVIVALEAVALFGGIQVLRLLGWAAQAGVAWTAFIVGVHFVALWPVWRAVSILIPGIGLTVLGLAGLVMVWTRAVEWVPFVSGVLSGMVLLTGSVFYAQKQFRALAAR